MTATSTTTRTMMISLMMSSTILVPYCSYHSYIVSWAELEMLHRWSYVGVSTMMTLLIPLYCPAGHGCHRLQKNQKYHRYLHEHPSRKAPTLDVDVEIFAVVPWSCVVLCCHAMRAVTNLPVHAVSSQCQPPQILRDRTETRPRSVLEALPTRRTSEFV